MVIYDKTTAFNDGTTAYNNKPTAYEDGTTAYNDKPKNIIKYYHIRQLRRSIVILHHWGQLVQEYPKDQS